MNVSQNLQYLRKRDKLTQEDLADKLGVSRQSVSKWETGEAYPETEKLLAICDLFNVSLDSLMRGTIEDPETENVTKNTDIAVLGKHIDKFSRAIAAGVALVLLGVAVCVALAGASYGLEQNLSEFTAVMGAVAVISFTAVAVFLFVFYGMAHERFRKAHPTVNADPKASTAPKRLHFTMACLISAILIDVVGLIVFSALIDSKIISTKNDDRAVCFVVAAFMGILSAIVGGIVHCGIQYTKYSPTEYNKQNAEESHPSPRKKVADAVCGAIMMTATAIFLIVGFVLGAWHPSWIVFPVGGIICGITTSILKIK